MGHASFALITFVVSLWWRLTACSDSWLDGLHIFQNHLTLTTVNLWGKADEQQASRLLSSISEEQGQSPPLTLKGEALPSKAVRLVEA